METPFPQENHEELVDFFGQPADKNNLVRITFPYTMYYNDRKVSSTRVHKLIAEPVLRVLNKVKDYYTEADIKRLGFDQFGGGYVDRNIRGGNRKSTHAWGIALDFDPKRNTLHMRSNDAGFAHPDCDYWWECWESEGFYSLGRHHNYDWMHIQACYRD